MSLHHKNLEIVEASLSVPMNMLKRYNITIDGKRTTVTLEPKSWEVLKSISERENIHISEICDLIAKRRGTAKNMSSAIRVFLIAYLDARTKYLEKARK
jgi:predicted DNA-binding ribbon-helix-helix protein